MLLQLHVFVALFAACFLQDIAMEASNGFAGDEVLREHNRQINEIVPFGPALTGTVERPHTWLKSAQDMIASPAGHVAVQVAKELLNRSAGNSQVLSLNLTNLIIILLLKILIFTAGMLGAGHWGGGYGYGGFAARSMDSREGDGEMPPLLGLNDGEDYLITGFLAAQGTGLDDCLFAAACNSPSVAFEYAKAARALLEGIEKFEGRAVQNVRYNDLIALIETAAYDGLRGRPCNTTVKCDDIL